MFDLLRRDFARFFPHWNELGAVRKLYLLVDTPGLHAVVTYRFGRWVEQHIRFKPVRYPLLLVHYVLSRLCIICWGMFIDTGADIGPGLFLGHFGGVIIGPVRMGEDCNIGHQVTIGARADGIAGLPVFGDRVWVGAGSLIYGGVTIGDGVTISPYTVVSRNLPPRVVVSGNPMRVVTKDYDNSFAIYGTRPPAYAASAPPEVVAASAVDVAAPEGV